MQVAVVVVKHQLLLAEKVAVVMVVMLAEDTLMVQVEDKQVQLI